VVYAELGVLGKANSPIKIYSCSEILNQYALTRNLVTARRTLLAPILAICLTRLPPQDATSLRVELLPDFRHAH